MKSYIQRLKIGVERDEIYSENECEVDHIYPPEIETPYWEVCYKLKDKIFTVYTNSPDVLLEVKNVQEVNVDSEQKSWEKITRIKR